MCACVCRCVCACAWAHVSGHGVCVHGCLCIHVCVCDVHLCERSCHSFNKPWLQKEAPQFICSALIPCQLRSKKTRGGFEHWTATCITQQASVIRFYIRLSWPVCKWKEHWSDFQLEALKMLSHRNKSPSFLTHRSLSEELCALAGERELGSFASEQAVLGARHALDRRPPWLALRLSAV